MQYTLLIAVFFLLALVALATGSQSAGQHKTAIFGGGCFWCMERPFDELDGVIATTSGYTGGFKDQPTYHEVGGGSTGHRESVQILYDPSKVSYETLLNVFSEGTSMKL